MKRRREASKQASRLCERNSSKGAYAYLHLFLPSHIEFVSFHGAVERVDISSCALVYNQVFEAPGLDDAAFSMRGVTYGKRSHRGKASPLRNQLPYVLICVCVGGGGAFKGEDDDETVWRD